MTHALLYTVFNDDKHDDNCCVQAVTTASCLSDHIGRTAHCRYKTPHYLDTLIQSIQVYIDMPHYRDTSMPTTVAERRVTELWSRLNADTTSQTTLTASSIVCNTSSSSIEDQSSTPFRRRAVVIKGPRASLGGTQVFIHSRPGSHGQRWLLLDSKGSAFSRKSSAEAEA